MKAVLRDFKAIGTLGVGVTGGEPMLREDLLELLRAGSRLGLHMHLNTDGFRVDDASARELVRAGVRSVNVSLDGASAGEHDLARGRTRRFGQTGEEEKAKGRERRGNNPGHSTHGNVLRNVAASKRIINHIPVGQTTDRLRRSRIHLRA